VEHFPPNCTSWKQPCDQGIINALKTRYKFLYLCNVLSFYELNDNEKTALIGQGKKLRRGSAGVRFGNPAHLLDAAKYLKEGCDSILPISIENCFRKADISIEF
jgi:DDE superfamily endonuclease